MGDDALTAARTRVHRLFREGMVLSGLALAASVGSGVLLAVSTLPAYLPIGGLITHLIIAYQSLGTAVAGIRGIPGVPPAQLPSALNALATVKRTRLWWLWACWTVSCAVVGGAAVWESAA